MSEDILSQSEVESLLSAMDSGVAENPPEPEVAVPREKITPYDFKRPERVGKEQMRALQSMHEGFGRNFGARLSALIRSIVEVKLTSVDQLTYSEFLFSLENPTCFNILQATPLEGNLILDINPSILYPIIDRLLGGGKDSGLVGRRPLTEIELKLVKRITDEFLAELQEAWEDVLQLQLSVERVESNPQLVQIVPPNEVVILVSFELTIGEVRGMLNLCIPFNSIERFAMKLSSNSWGSYGKSGKTDETMRHLSDQLNHSEVDVVVTLANSTISMADMIGLRVGDIITTEKDVRIPLDVEVGGVAKFSASAGALKGKKAIRIEGLH